MPEPTTPLEWLRYLYPQLIDRRPMINRYSDYHRGRRILEVVRRDFEEIFEGLIDPPRTNLCAIAAEAAVERLDVDAHEVMLAATTGDDGDDASQASTVDERGRRLADRVWHENDLDVWAEVAHTDTSVRGMSYSIVWPTPAGNPAVSIESARNVIGFRPMRPPYDMTAVIKVADDPWDGGEIAEVYLPEGVFRYRRGNGSAGAMLMQGGTVVYGRGTDAGDRGGLVLPAIVSGVAADGWREMPYDNVRGNALMNPWRALGVVPAVEFDNAPSVDEPPMSDLEHVTPLQDASDKLLADLMIAASFGAVPMRYATGVTLGKREYDQFGRVRFVDDRGNEVAPFDTRGDRVWISPDPNSKMGTLEGSTLEGFIKGIQAIRTDFRALTRVPYHYFDMGGTSGTAGELLKALEGPLQRRIERMARRRGSSWRRVMRLALYLLDAQYGGAQVRTRWKDTETRSEAQQADAASKLDSIGVPLEVTLSHILGWDRSTIERTLQLRERDRVSADAALSMITGAGVRPPVGVSLPAASSGLVLPNGEPARAAA